MWMSDKPLIQEALAEDISKLIHCFEGVEFGIQFFGAFLKVMSNEWFGLDQWRMDKFMMVISLKFNKNINYNYFFMLFSWLGDVLVNFLYFYKIMIGIRNY